MLEKNIQKIIIIFCNGCVNRKKLVTIPIGLKIGLINKSKNCFKSIVRMINGFNKNQFLVIFDEEDVDFQLIIN